VLRSGHADVPALEREDSLGPHINRVRELYAECKGNLVRVHEKLAAAGIEVGYSTLTGFCRRHGMGPKAKVPAGRYHFEPGEEMQHDTSPHKVVIGGVRRRVECASLVYCYSRMIYAQVYRRWSRFECRLFLTEALQSFGGACTRCMIDNSSVVIWHGVGAEAVPAPAMAKLAERFGFDFRAHRIGDANRSARVERPFHYIENNFYPGREFADVADLNQQLRTWCDDKNHRQKRHIGAAPFELFAAEKPRLVPLPLFVPEVYDLHTRRVDVEGYVSVHANRYSVPVELIGRRVEVRETKDRIRVFDGRRPVADHDRMEPGSRERVLLSEHRGQRRGYKPPPPSAEEQRLRAAHPELANLCDQLRKRHGGRAMKAVRKLHRMYMDYPTDTLAAAVHTALAYGLADLDRIERMVLGRIAGDFFRLPTDPDSDTEDDDG
jgi:hypothetical protein